MTETELATLTAGLPERFADRLPAPELDGLRSMARSGEWDELLDLLVQALRQTQAPVSGEERDQLRAAFTGWGMPTGILASLNVNR
ncbi:MAG TPA: hypothetical protein VGM53_05365 [Streptosporangiaceae bacterium]